MLDGAEWTSSRTQEKMVDVFERTILRRICVPTKDRDAWRCRFNRETYDLFKEARLSVVIRIFRQRWAVQEWIKSLCLGDMHMQQEELSEVER
jgi:hypothetical protein